MTGHARDPDFDFGPGHPATVQPRPRRWRRRLVLALAVIAALAAGVLYLRGGPGSLTRWLEGTPLDPGPGTTRLYKWRDGRGDWHVTDDPPPAGTRYEPLEYRSDVNVLPVVPRE
jgi:hypothetical protein